MGVRLGFDEAWDRLCGAHTVVVTTLRRDGWPVSLPMWFVAREELVYLRTGADSATLARVRRDPRGTLLVESGTAWAELAAVMLYVTIAVVDDEEEAERARTALDAKYAAFRTPASRLPDATRRRYANRVMLRAEPTRRFLSWDNAKLRLKA